MSETMKDNSTKVSSALIAPSSCKQAEAPSGKRDDEGLNLKSWGDLMLFLDEMANSDYGDEISDAVALGLEAKELGLGPLFSRAEAKVTMEVLNDYLETKLELHEVLKVINLDLWDNDLDIVILPRKQRYVIVILYALMNFLDNDQKYHFLLVSLLMFHISPISFRTEISKFRSCSTKITSHGVVRKDVLLLFDRFVDLFLNCRRQQYLHLQSTSAD